MNAIQVQLKYLLINKFYKKKNTPNSTKPTEKLRKMELCRRTQKKQSEHLKPPHGHDSAFKIHNKPIRINK